MIKDGFRWGVFGVYAGFEGYGVCFFGLDVRRMFGCTDWRHWDVVFESARMAGSF